MIDAPTAAAGTAAGMAVGGGIKWLFERRAAKRREPVQDVALLSKAAAAIGEASTSLLAPLQQEIVRNGETIRGLTEKVAAVEAVLEAMHVREADCQRRLAALEGLASSA